MIISILFLTTFGEWVEANLLGLVIAVVGWLSSAAVLVWKFSQLAAEAKETRKTVEALAKAFADHADELQQHVSDGEKHVNHLYMKSMSDRIGKVETAVETGFTKVNDKLDRWAERLLK